MAITKIHPIKVSIGKAIKYICNPDKTDEAILIDSYACAPETADFSFKYALSRSRDTAPNLAYHLIQSFAPGEVSVETAHEIGKVLAQKVLGLDYSYVVTTHIDRGHIHNHIIFCAADNHTHKKYNDCKKSYYRIRNISDNLCREHGLSVIENTSGERGKSYKEWQKENEGNSWKSLIRNDIDKAINSAASYDIFLGLLQDMGYSIKGDDIGENSSKYISFKAPGGQRFIRGSMKSLGRRYTRESIIDRIAGKDTPKPRDLADRIFERKGLIDTSQEKFKDSPSLTRWANLQNLKTAAASYEKAGSLKELQAEIDKTSEGIKEARSQVVSLDHQIRNLSELIDYAKQYAENKKYNFRYRKSKDPERYLEAHEMELMMFDAAKRKLIQMGIKPEGIDLAKMQEDLLNLQSQRAFISSRYSDLQKKEKELTRHWENITAFLDKDAPKIAPEKGTTKTRGEGRM